MGTIFGLLILIAYFIFAFLWMKLGRFLITLISYDFCWKEFKEEWKKGSEGLEEVLYLLWVFIVPIQIYYIIKNKISKK